MVIKLLHGHTLFNQFLLTRRQKKLREVSLTLCDTIPAILCSNKLPLIYSVSLEARKHAREQKKPRVTNHFWIYWQKYSYKRTHNLLSCQTWSYLSCHFSCLCHLLYLLSHSKEDFIAIKLNKSLPIVI